MRRPRPFWADFFRFLFNDRLKSYTAVAATEDTEVIEKRKVRG